MRFANLFKSLGLFSVFAFSVHAQDEMLNDPEVPSPNVDGLFEEELEPLDESDIVRPQQAVPPPPNFDHNSERMDDEDREPQPAERNFDRTPPPSPSRPSFPAPRSVPSPSPKSLPSLPPGVKIPNDKEKVRMDFVQVEIDEIVKYFAERLQKRFIYDPSILSGKITIVSPNDVTLREAWGAFLSALEVRG